MKITIAKEGNYYGFKPKPSILRVWTDIRNFLISLLAGKSPIILNTKIENGTLHVERRSGFIKNVEIDNTRYFELETKIVYMKKCFKEQKEFIRDTDYKEGFYDGMKYLIMIIDDRVK